MLCGILEDYWKEYFRRCFKEVGTGTYLIERIACSQSASLLRIKAIEKVETQTRNVCIMATVVMVRCFWTMREEVSYVLYASFPHRAPSCAVGV